MEIQVQAGTSSPEGIAGWPPKQHPPFSHRPLFLHQQGGGTTSTSGNNKALALVLPIHSAVSAVVAGGGLLENPHLNLPTPYFQLPAPSSLDRPVHPSHLPLSLLTCEHLSLASLFPSCHSHVRLHSFVPPILVLVRSHSLLLRIALRITLHQLPPLPD
jgi:hypothetical protein